MFLYVCTRTIMFFIFYKSQVMRKQIINKNLLSNFKTHVMEKHANRFFGGALVKATACAFLSLGFMPVMAETLSPETDAIDPVG